MSSIQNNQSDYRDKEGSNNLLQCAIIYQTPFLIRTNQRRRQQSTAVATDDIEIETKLIQLVRQSIENCLKF